jgi:hypothetical protein
MPGKFRKIPPIKVFRDITKPFGLRFPAEKIQEVTLSLIIKKIKNNQIIQYFNNLPLICMYYYPCHSPHKFKENNIDLEDIDILNYDAKKCLFLLRDLVKLYDYEDVIIRHEDDCDTSLFVIPPIVSSSISKSYIDSSKKYLSKYFKSGVSPSFYDSIFNKLSQKINKELETPKKPSIPKHPKKITKDLPLPKNIKTDLPRESLEDFPTISFIDTSSIDILEKSPPPSSLSNTLFLCSSPFNKVFQYYSNNELVEFPKDTLNDSSRNKLRNQRIKISDPTLLTTFSNIDNSGDIYYADLQKIFPGAISFDL